MERECLCENARVKKRREREREKRTDERGRGCSMFQKMVCLSFPHVRMRSGSKGLHDADVMPPECAANVFFDRRRQERERISISGQTLMTIHAQTERQREFNEFDKTLRGY